jgi:hypothetical protein
MHHILRCTADTLLPCGLHAGPVLLTWHMNDLKGPMMVYDNLICLYTCDRRRGLFYVYFMYILCIFYVYFMYILCIFYVYFMYILCIFYVYFMYILCFLCV